MFQTAEAAAFLLYLFIPYIYIIRYINSGIFLRNKFVVTVSNTVSPPWASYDSFY